MLWFSYAICFSISIGWMSNVAVLVAADTRTPSEVPMVANKPKVPGQFVLRQRGRVETEPKSGVWKEQNKEAVWNCSDTAIPMRPMTRFSTRPTGLCGASSSSWTTSATNASFSVGIRSEERSRFGWRWTHPSGYPDSS